MKYLSFLLVLSLLAIQPSTAASTTAADLDVTFIQRTPLYSAYCVQYPWDIPGQPGIPALCPGTENAPRWPAQGETVTFRAHIANQGSQASPAAAYTWTIDGQQVASGTLPPLAPGETTSVTYAWPWAHPLSPDGQRTLGDHWVGLRVDPTDAIPESHESNNFREDRTSAKSLAIYITPAMLAAYDQPVDPSLPASAEDWLQKQIAAMNNAFAASQYPATPQGATDRVRIDRIIVTDEPPEYDFAHDGRWFVDADYRHGASGYYDPALDIDWGLVHELGHQVALIDLYASNLYPTNVFVPDRQGRPVNFGFEWPRPDLMFGGDTHPYNDPHLYSSHSAGGFSSNKGYRNGYYGAYQFDIPLKNYLRLLDTAGNPVAGAAVALYQRQGPWDAFGGTGIDGTPEISGVTDSSGLLTLPNRPAGGGTTTRSGHVLHDNPFGVIDIVGVQNRFLVGIQQGSHEEFAWLDITAFNLAYWQGDTDYHVYDLQTHLPPPAAPAGVTLTSERLEGDRFSLCWQASPTPGVNTYRLYRAAAPDFVYQPVATVAAGLCYTDTVPWDGAHYTVTAVDDQGRESGFSPAAWAAPRPAPRAVLVTPAGDRLSLDSASGYALLRQDAAGRSLQHLGSVHLPLWGARFLAQDANGRLLVSHPGPEYDPEHSVHVLSPAGQPLFELGSYGSGPGQFDRPAGVAAWGEACTVAGPATPDSHTLLLAPFDGSATGAGGEPGQPAGVSFQPGRYGQAVWVDGSDTLVYSTAGNLNRAQGVVEFWLRPGWPGGDGQSYTFFEAGDEWSNRLRIMKDGGNNLRFMVWDSDTEWSANYNVAGWQANEWRHVAATWGASGIALYVDGDRVAFDSTARPPDSLASQMWVGSSLWHDQQAHALIDDLRISDIPRVGNSATCNRLLVVDNGNRRVLAFDSLGNFLSSFGGGPGDGTDYFLDPQGLAVDPQGRVIVVDRGLNRLALLGFDGQAFTWLGSFAPGLNAPTGVAAGSQGDLYVADSGSGRIVVLDSAGHWLAAYTHPDDGYSGVFQDPQGVAVHPDGVIVVADTGNGRVVTIQSARRVQLFLPVLFSPGPPGQR